MSKWHDALPTGFWRGLLDALAGARYYRIFRRDKYSGAAWFKRGYFRVTAADQEWFEEWKNDYRFCSIEEFNSRTWVVHVAMEAARNDPAPD